MGIRWKAALSGALLAVLCSCAGGDAGPEPSPQPPVERMPPPTSPGNPTSPTTPPPPPPPPVDPPPSSDVFAPGFHLALRHSVSVDAVTTYRLKIPITRAGKRLRITFRAGDGDLVVERANIGRSYKDTWRPPLCPTPSDPNALCAGKNGDHYGAIDGEVTPVTFAGGKPGFTAGARERVTSDPIDFPVIFREEVYVSFEARGAMSASAIALLQQSYSKTGSHSHRLENAVTWGGSWSPTPVGMATIEVEGAPGPVMIAIGDSITEGYVKGVQDLTDSWAYQAGKLAQVTTVNAAVSGDGITQTLANLDEEVFVLSGVTDCMVLIGTNDISSYSTTALTSKLTELYSRLKPFCRVWGATMPPKDETGGSKNDGGSELWNQMHATRRAVNAWIVANDSVTGAFDFSPILTDPERPNYFVPRYTEDGIHPTPEGYRVMGKEATRVINEKLPR